MSLRLTFNFVFCLLIFFCLSCKDSFNHISKNRIPYLTSSKVVLDGQLNERAWEQALIIDTLYRLDNRELQNISTKIHLFYDDEHLHVAATLLNDDIKAELTQRDSKIYKEHCFEIFFDPGNDGLDYYEIEINPLATVFDLMLKTSDHSYPNNVTEWHIPQNQFGVHIEGSLNDSADTDKFWSVEMSIPWSLTNEGKPSSKTEWRFNFLRMDYTQSGEEIWVWKNTEPRNIHIPEKWGLLEF